MCIWILLLHWKRFHGFWNLVWSFGLLSSIKSYFWDLGSLEDSSGSVHRKRVPQVRAREDNRDGYRGSPGLAKMVLICVLTRDLAFGFKWLICSFRQIGRPIVKIGRPIVGFSVAICSRVGVSADRYTVSVDRYRHCSMPWFKLKNEILKPSSIGFRFPSLWSNRIDGYGTP